MDDAKGPYAVVDLGELLEIDHAVIVEVPGPRDAKGKYVAVVYDTRTRRRLARVSAPKDNQSLEALFTDLARSLYAQVDFEHRRDVSPAAQTGQHRPFYRRWWFWTGVAATAAAVAIPLVIMSSDGSGPSCPDGSVCGTVVWQF